MKLTSLEDRYGRKKPTLKDELSLTPLYPEQKPCSSCGKKGININITNTANGNTASGNSNSNSNANNGFTNTQSSRENPAQTIAPIPRRGIVREEQPPVVVENSTPVLEKILAKLNERRPEASTIETERKPDKVRTVVKEREVRIPVERRVDYVRPQELTVERERQIPYVRDQEILVPLDRVKTQVIEREIPTVYERIKNKVQVIRANQPPAPPSFT